LLHNKQRFFVPKERTTPVAGRCLRCVIKAYVPSALGSISWAVVWNVRMGDE
jgi:hypothetical protein